MTVAGRWRYVYRAVDQYGQIIDVYVSPRRDTEAARRHYRLALPRLKALRLDDQIARCEQAIGLSPSG